MLAVTMAFSGFVGLNGPVRAVLPDTQVHFPESPYDLQLTPLRGQARHL